MKKKNLLLFFTALSLFVLWYAFRPEKLFVNQTVNESLSAPNQTAANKILYKGNFYGVAHESKGTAEIYEFADGRRTLRFTDFETSNGPDVHVYLSVADKPQDNESVKKDGFVEISLIKGNIGDQNYELPQDLDLAKYKSVVLWCQRFGVNFGAASLSINTNVG